MSLEKDVRDKIVVNNIWIRTASSVQTWLRTRSGRRVFLRLKPVQNHACTLEAVRTQG